MKKKLVSALLISAMAVGMLAGCGGKDENTASNGGTTAADSGSSDVETSGDNSRSVDYDSVSAESLKEEAQKIADSTDFSEAVEIEFASAGKKGATDASIFENWMEEVTELSGGKITFNYYSDGSVGTDSDILPQVMDGTLDAGACGIGPLSQYSADLANFQMPFLITDYELEYKACQTPEWQAILNAAEEATGCLKIVGQYDVGLRHFASTKGPIETIDDMKGLKIRTASTDILQEGMAAVGANPITTAYNEIYTSLQNKVVDAEEVNYATFAGQSHYEIVKNFSEIGMYPYTCFIYFNSSVYDNLPDGYADLMQAVMNEQEYIYLTETIVKADEESKQKCIDNGVAINEVQDPEDFEAACAGLYDEYAAKSGLAKAFIEKVQSMK